MKRRPLDLKCLSCVTAVAITIGCGLPFAVLSEQPQHDSAAHRPVFDLERDFSLSLTSGNPWSYGYLSKLDDSFVPYPVASTNFTDEGIPIETWSIEGVGPSAIYYNRTTNTGNLADRGEIFYPNSPYSLTVHPGVDEGAPDTRVVFRLTVPHHTHGKYLLTSIVNDVATGRNVGNMDFQITQNGAPIYSEIPNGYDVTVTNRQFVYLSANDRIDFRASHPYSDPRSDYGLRMHAVLKPVPPNAAFPSIVSQPQSQSVLAHSTVTLSLEAEGSKPLSYQWIFNDVPLAGQTNASLLFTDVSRINAGTYWVSVTNDYGSVSRDAVVLVVIPNQIPGRYDVSEDFSLDSNPNGVWGYGFAPALTGPFTPYSQPAGQAWADPALSISSVSWVGPAGTPPADAVNLGVGIGEVLNDFGVIRFTVPPEAVGDYQLSCLARGRDETFTGDVDFHIVKNGVELYQRWLPSDIGTGYTNRLTLGAGDTIDFMGGSGLNYWQAYVGWGSMTLRINLTRVSTKPALPRLLRQPESVGVKTVGQEVTFAVVADGTHPLRYQWRVNGVAISGATNAALALRDAQPAESGAYSVQVSNALGLVVSSNAILSVLPAPASAARLPIYDVARDFATTQNPNGAWSYGYAPSVIEPFVEYRNLPQLPAAIPFVRFGLIRTNLSEQGVPLASWSGFHVGSSTVVYNSTTNAATVDFSGTDLPPRTVVEHYPPGALILRPGADGDYADNLGAVRFTLPDGPKAWYRLEADVTTSFDAPPNIGDAVDFHIRNAGGLLLGTNLERGAQTHFEQAMLLGPGQAIDFLTGRGPDFQGFASSVQLRATFTWLSNSYPPVILVPPQSITAIEGEWVTFSIMATGTGSLAYFWKHNGQLIPDSYSGNHQTGVVVQAGARWEGTFTVTVVGEAGAVQSATVTLTVLHPPRITQHPISQAVLAGSDVTFLVAATGGMPLLYQWRRDGVDIPGATESALALTNVQPGEVDGVYSVRVSNADGTLYSSNAVLIVPGPLSPPAITAVSGAQSVPVRGSMTLSVTAVSATPVSYQWRWNSADIAGATNSTLALPSVQLIDAGTYSVRVANGAGTALSRSLVVTVIDDRPGGQIYFANRFLPINAPIFDVDGVTRLAGAGFLVQLYAGADDKQLAPVGPAVPFREGNAAGYFVAGMRLVPGVLPWQTAFVQVRVWEAAGWGTFEQARSAGAKTGMSDILQIIIKAPPWVPPSLNGLRSFALSLPVTPVLHPPPILAEGALLPGGGVQWAVRGEAGAVYLIETSSNLLNWTELMTVTNASGTSFVVDPAQVTVQPCLFYRARLRE